MDNLYSKHAVEVGDVCNHCGEEWIIEVRQTVRLADGQTRTVPVARLCEACHEEAGVVTLS